MDQANPFAEPLLAAALSIGVGMKEQMLRMEGGVLSAEEAAAALGLEETSLSAIALFHLNVDGKPVYPAFQFCEGGRLPGVEQILSAFRVTDPWMRVNFMLTGDVRLQGQKPLDLLRNGNLADVVRAARAYGEHGAG